MQIQTQPLTLNACDFRRLFALFGPTLGFWRAAEIAAFRLYAEQMGGFERPILDLGCGDGLVTSFVLPHVDVGLDPDANALSHAARLDLYGRVEPVSMEAAGLPEGSIGTVISNSVLEHAAHLDNALAASARVLKPGGRLVFTVPTEAFSRWLAIPNAGYAARRNRGFNHRNLWPVEEWARRLERAGLQVECVWPYLGAGWVRAWDALELIQQVRIGRGERLFARMWKRMPSAWYQALARRAARIDLSAPPPGGGRLISARKI